MTQLSAGAPLVDVLRTLRPSLAVRATGCIQCHAVENSPVITDFGYGGDGNGADYFFGQDPASHVFHKDFVYANSYASAGFGWQTAKITGTVYAAKATLPDAVRSALNLDPGITTLAQFLQSVAGIKTSVQPTVQELSSVYIGAPSKQQIIAVAGQISGHNWVYLPSSPSSIELSGLELSSDGKFVQNSGNSDLKCDGDLVVSLPLFLNNLSLHTTDNGCRIYALQTVFIQGPIQYTGGTLANLQVSSAEAILLGFGRGGNFVIDRRDGTIANDSVHYRFIWDKGEAAGYFTREPGLTVQQKNQRIMDESLLIPNLTDAALQPNRNVTYSHLLLNAPHVHSRYGGDFKGVVIAEVSLFDPGQFAFEYDETFSQIPILPLLPASEVLSVVK